MRCDHRFKLVGYRERAPSEPSTPGVLVPAQLDAVLACLKCPREKLVQVDVIPPAPVVEMLRGPETPEEG